MKKCIFLCLMATIMFSCGGDDEKIDQQVKEKQLAEKLLGTWEPTAYRLDEDDSFQEVDPCLFTDSEYRTASLPRTYIFDINEVMIWYHTCEQNPEGRNTKWKVMELDGVKDIVTWGGEPGNGGGSFLFRVIEISEDEVALSSDVPYADERYFIELKLKRL